MDGMGKRPPAPYVQSALRTHTRSRHSGGSAAAAHSDAAHATGDSGQAAPEPAAAVTTVKCFMQLASQADQLPVQLESAITQNDR